MPVVVKKYKFHIRKTNFIGFIIKLKQISIDLKKIKAIVNWQDLKSVIRLKSFLRFCNYYHRFIVK
jgi:type III secretory pathway component EscU